MIMSVKNYSNFDLFITKKGEQKYQARVIYSPAGQASADFSLSLSELESKWRDGPQAYGEFLFETVFQPKIKNVLTSSQNMISSENEGLCIRLRFEENLYELIQLRWERLYDPESSNPLALSDKTPIVRYLEVSKPEKSLSVILPLRVLVMISNPMNSAPLDTEGEFQNLENSLQELISRNQVILDRVPSGTESALREKLRKSNYHIFHYIGHGGFDVKSQKGYLLLEDDRQQSIKINADLLSAILGDHPSLRLAFLNTCQSATTSQKDMFSGVAQRLVEKELPAVIAMQSDIEDQLASILASEFYKSLSDGYPVDAALTEARKAIASNCKEVEWAIPALFIHTDNSLLFDVNRTLEGADLSKPNINPNKLFFDISSKRLNFIYKNKMILLYQTGLQADINSLARYIAWQMNKRSEKELQIREWTASNEDQTEIHKLVNFVTQPTIFIFHNISPENVNYDLSTLYSTLKEVHFIILATDMPKAAWRLKDKDVKFWLEFSEKEIYSTKIIKKTLNKRLSKSEDCLPDHLLKEQRSQGTILGIKLKDIAKELDSVEEASFFVQILCEKETKIEKSQDVWEAVDLAKNKELFIKRQYSRLSNLEDQLLALGLCFFDKLFETQFFLALEKVIDQSWGGNIPSAGILDYCHLKNLHIFFETDELETKERKFKNRVGNQSQLLLDVVWETHRRHILLALPVLSRIVKESVLPEYKNDELYQYQAQRKQLRTTIGNAISYVGLKSVDHVEDVLLELASGPNPNGDAHYFYKASMQSVAANAIAQWYQKDEKQLFDLLKRWQARRWKKTNVEIDKTGVELTIARAVNYIIRDYSPTPLPKPLTQLLYKLFKSRDEAVREFFNEYIAPKIFHPDYLPQLDNILFEMAKVYKQHDSLVKGLMKSQQPEIIVDILQGWYHHFKVAEEDARVNSKDLDRSWRAVLVAVIKTAILLEEVDEIKEIIPKLVSNVVQDEFDLFFTESSHITSDIKLFIFKMINQEITNNGQDYLLSNLVYNVYGLPRDTQLRQFFEESNFLAIFLHHLIYFNGTLLDKVQEEEDLVFNILDLWRKGWSFDLQSAHRTDLIHLRKILTTFALIHEKLNRFDELRLLLFEFFVKAKEQKRSKMALDMFTSIYVNQSKSQENGDKNLMYQTNRHIASGEYGTTAIEQEMIDWLTVEPNPDYAPIALQVLVGFSRQLKLQEADADKINTLHHERSANVKMTSLFVAKFISSFSSSDKPKNMMLLSEAVKLYNLYPFATELTLQKWSLSNNRKLKSIACSLKYNIRTTQYKRGILLFIIFIFFLMCIVFFMFLCISAA